MTTPKRFWMLAMATALGAALAPTARAWTLAPVAISCTGDGLAQNECGNPQTIPDCEVTCLGGKASCSDAQCDTIYVEGPLGPTDEEVAHFYIGPVCACVGGWNRLDSVAHRACLSELFRRTDSHRAKVAKALSSCELSVLAGRVTLPAGGTCADDDARTAQSIAGYRSAATQSILRKCSSDTMTAIYGTDGPESAATFVAGLLRRAEGDAAAGVGLPLRLAVTAP